MNYLNNLALYHLIISTLQIFSFKKKAKLSQICSDCECIKIVCE